MLANLDLSHRLVFSEAVLLALIDRGMLREDAYRVVQESAMKAWQDGVDFGELVKQNPAVKLAGLADADIEAAMDPRRHSAGRDVIFQRLATLQF
jgi:adenylosuccinate lyase